MKTSFRAWKRKQLDKALAAQRNAQVLIARVPHLADINKLASFASMVIRKPLTTSGSLWQHSPGDRLGERYINAGLQLQALTMKFKSSLCAIRRAEHFAKCVRLSAHHALLARELGTQH